MAHIYKVEVVTSSKKEVNVVAENETEATAKLTLAEGESVAVVTDEGEVTL